MTVQYVHKPKIADDTQQCALDLKMPTLGGEVCVIPYGQAATQKQSAPKQMVELPDLVAVDLLVFKDPSLDKSKAGNAEFIPMFKGKDKLGENEAIGYFYIFINGFLWREVAALPQGALSEVDLRLYHDKNFRSFNTANAFELVIPTRAIGLLSTSTSADVPDLQIAFSRVQWSWDYINKMGGMWPSDTRFDKTPQLSKCENINQATDNRAARMQSIDLTSAPSWASIENMGAPNSKPCIYVHDLVGIAQSQKLDADYELHLLKEHQAILQRNPFYKSAMLAHQLFLNEKLWETKLTTPPTGRQVEYPTLVLKDEQSEQARDAGRHLSPDELEKYLVGLNPDWIIERLDNYIVARKHLQGLHESKCSQSDQPFSNICSGNLVQAPPSWQAVMCDFSTLSPCGYPFAFELCHEQLASLMLPNTLIPAFIPALTNDTEKQRLSSELNELFNNGKAYNEGLVGDDSSWLNVQFCPNDDLYGQNLSAATADEDKIGQELGAFDPRKLQQEVKNAELKQPGIPALFVESRLLSVIEKILSETLMYWERIFKERAFAGREERLFYARVGSLAKSFDVSPLHDIQLHDMDAVPNDRMIISMSFVRHPLIEKIKSTKGRAALKNALASIAKGKPVNNNQLITIARELHMDINPEGAAQFKTQSGQPYMLKQVRAEILQMLNEVNDIQGTFKTVSGAAGKVLPAPARDTPASIVYEHNRDLAPAVAARMVSPNNFGKMWFEAKRGSSIALLALTGITAYYIYAEYEKEFAGKGDLYQFGKHIAVIGGVIAAVGSVWENYSSTAGNSALTKARLTGEARQLSKLLGKLVKFTYLRSFGGAMGILMSGVQMADAVEMWNKHDRDAATVNMIAGMMGMTSAIYGAIFASMGPIGWGLFLGSIVLSILAVSLMDTEAEKWCKFGPFAKNKKGIWQGERDAEYNDFSNPEAYHKFIMAVLFSPKADYTEVAKNQYTIEVSIPNFIKGESELALKFGFKLKDVLAPYNVESKHYSYTGVTGTKEYQPVHDEKGQLIKALYTINIAFANPNHVLQIDKVRPFPELRYDKNLTLPLDFSAIAKPIANPSYPNPWIL